MIASVGGKAMAGDPIDPKIAAELLNEHAKGTNVAARGTRFLEVSAERAVGIEEVICNMNFAGVLDHRQVLDSMQLFAAKVMPQVA
jgi:hypothetical protein